MTKVTDTNMHSKWKPNTVRTYLNSLRLFTDFLINMSVLRIPDFRYNMAILQTLNNQCLKWCNSCIKEDKNTEGTTAATKDSLTPTDLQTYLDSSRAKAASNLLDDGPKGEVSMADHTFVRNYLLFRLATANCQRTGCFTNMTRRIPVG